MININIFVGSISIGASFISNNIQVIEARDNKAVQNSERFLISFERSSLSLSSGNRYSARANVDSDKTKNEL
ncbi:hypothetical protein [Bacillus spizizenii]|uniref:hypothetical protein n=1 Tax=Bacillus spizizenii TaxID=96241 RepID=UPI001054E3DC|nr:hypothetical protein [Bacillus spizizenii]